MSFLDLDDLDDDALEAVLHRAAELERSPRADTLRGRAVALLFLAPSLRTLASMQAGIAQLAGESIVLTPGAGSWPLEWRHGAVMDGEAAEHVEEAVPVLESYVDALAVRTFARGRDLAETLADPVLGAVRAAAHKPLVNMESSVSHPLQALADWKTLDDLDVPRRGGRFVLTWARHPKALPLAVPSSVLRMACRRGMDVTLCAPEEHVLPPAILDGARRAADESGGSLGVVHDPGELPQDVHVVYAKSWAAPATFDGANVTSLREGWCIDERWFSGARPGAAFMHCLPVRRGVVVRDSILDGPASVVVRQAANRLHVQKALLERLLSGEMRP